MKINNERKTNTGGGNTERKRAGERERARSEVSWRSRWRHNLSANLQECSKRGLKGVRGVRGVRGALRVPRGL